MSFYVYTLARPDGSVFYVGKGAGKRIHQHEWEAERGCTCHKCNVIRKIWRNGGEVQKEIVFRTSDERQALDCEIELIRFYGRENLANLTDGGDGASGRTITDEGRRRIAEANRTREHSLLSRIKKRLANLGRMQSDETREKIRQARIGHEVSEETRAKVGDASRARGVSRQAIERAREINTGKQHRPESIERMRESARNRSEETEERRRQALAAHNERERLADPRYAAMFDLLRQGVRPERIAELTGLGVRTVYRWKRELNL